MLNIVCSNFDSLGECKLIVLLLQWEIFCLSFFEKSKFNTKNIVSDFNLQSSYESLN